MGAWHVFFYRIVSVRKCRRRLMTMTKSFDLVLLLTIFLISYICLYLYYINYGVYEISTLLFSFLFDTYDVICE